MTTISPKTKKYVRIDTYGDLVMPLEVFERICDKIMIAKSEYEDGEIVLTQIKSFDKVHLHDVDEVKNLLVHDKLKNS